MAVIFHTGRTALCVSTCRPLFDAYIYTDKHHYSTVYAITIFGLHFTFEVVHYKG